MKPLRFVAAFIAVAGVFLGFASAQGPGGGLPPDLLNEWKSISWQKGPFKAPIGSVAEIQVPAGYKFTAQAGTANFLRLTGNMPTNADVALLCPESLDIGTMAAPGMWFLVFQWNPVGYVKDDDRNLDADGLLTTLKTGQEEANRMRRQNKLPGLNLLGWAKAPFYDPQTNLLTWATRIQGDGDNMIDVNYNSRLLGRGGFMSANMVVDEPSLEKNIDGYRKLLQGYSFLSGQRHAEFREGDKLAGLGLTALIAGGAAGVAAKTGLLTKLAKPIIAGIVFLGAAIAGLFRKIFGRRESA
jgi:uncharacterized membrane-anchored protein